MYKVGRVLKPAEVTLLDKDDSSLDKKEEVELILKELKGKARAVKNTRPLPKIVKDCYDYACRPNKLGIY